jgi:hypothetical protein
VALWAEADSLGTYNQRMNYQVWLYEGSNIIEFHYGPNSITDPFYLNEFSAPVALFIDKINIMDGTGGAAYGVGGPLNDISAVNFNQLSTEIPENAFFAEMPGDGFVIRFAPQTTASVKTSVKRDLRIYPTLTSQQLNVTRSSGERVAYVIRNLTGAEVMRGQLNGTNQTLDVTGLEAGVYFLQMPTLGHLTTEKFIKE